MNFKLINKILKNSVLNNSLQSHTIFSILKHTYSPLKRSLYIENNGESTRASQILQEFPMTPCGIPSVTPGIKFQFSTGSRGKPTI